MGRTIKLILYFFLYQFAVSGLFTGAYMLFSGSFEIPTPADEWYITYLLVIQLAFTLLMSMHLLYWKYVSLDKQTWSYYNSPKLLLTSLVLIIGLGLWNNYLSEIVDLPNTMENFFEQMMVHPLGVIATVIMAPIMEELLFRGAIEGYLLKKWKNPMGAILLSAFLFGLVHGNPAQIPFAFIIGIALGWMYYMTGSLVPGIFMHFINNGSAVLLFWLMDGSDAGLIETLGFPVATILAVIGVGVTVLCVLYTKKQLKDKRICWYKDGEELLS